MNFDDVPKPFVFMDEVPLTSQFSKVSVNGFTRKYYEDILGEKLRVGEIIDIPVGWLPNGTKAYVEVVCPRCEETRSVRLKELKMRKQGYCKYCTRQKVFDEIIGKTFGKLSVIGYGKGVVGGNGFLYTTVKCKCECGNELEYRASSIKYRGATSCGKGKCRPSYNHSLTLEERNKNVKERKDSETKKIKKIVRQRDRNTCWFCGSHGSIVHHLNDFANHPEGRTDVNNLVCVCNKCHNDFHRWSGGTKALTTTLHNYLYKYYIMSLDRTLDK